MSVVMITPGTGAKVSVKEKDEAAFKERGFTRAGQTRAVVDAEEGARGPDDGSGAAAASAEDSGDSAGNTDGEAADAAESGEAGDAAARDDSGGGAGETAAADAAVAKPQSTRAPRRRKPKGSK